MVYTEKELTASCCEIQVIIEDLSTLFTTYIVY